MRNYGPVDQMVFSRIMDYNKQVIHGNKLVTLNDPSWESYLKDGRFIPAKYFYGIETSLGDFMIPCYPYPMIVRHEVFLTLFPNHDSVRSV